MKPIKSRTLDADIQELIYGPGHRYRSGAPPLPGAGPPTSPEQRLRRILDEGG